jgi:hypothetical protein
MNLFMSGWRKSGGWAFLVGAAAGFLGLLAVVFLYETHRSSAADPHRNFFFLSLFFPFPGMLGALCGVVAGSACPRREALWRGLVYGALPWMTLAGSIRAVTDSAPDFVLLLALFALSGAASGGISAGIRTGIPTDFDRPG